MIPVTIVRRKVSGQSITMPTQVQNAAFRLALAVAMTLGLLLSPVGNSASHNPAALAAAEVERHTELEAHLAQHGHVHEDGSEDEQCPGHLHGHNPADHSHESPDTLSAVNAPPCPFGPAWQACPATVADLGMTFRFERPPRPLSVL
jgi:hypothetical protein